MTRKLATIQRIKAMMPIKGADRIELAFINGWQVVTQVGQHKVGDLVVFYEIDSFLPSSDPRYASFSDRFTNWGDKHGMRLKTIRLRKQLSQGLIMPVAAFPELTAYEHGSLPIQEGDDVTEVLKIEKWEPIEKESTAKGPGSSAGKRFPAFIRKTDQERIQNYGHMVEMALDEEFEATMKKDGSSLTVARIDPASPFYADASAMVNANLKWHRKIKLWFDGKMGKAVPIYMVCSRNVMLPLEGESNFHLASHRALQALRKLPAGTSLAVQGEVVAPDIQDNYEKVSTVEFHMFDLFDIDTQTYVLPIARRAFATANKIPHAKVVDGGKLRDIVRYKDGDDIVALLLTYATGPGDNPGVQREGVVFKSESRDFSFKAVSNEYLLATGK
jgi:RNA ligase (TIGR02306 family)